MTPDESLPHFSTIYLRETVEILDQIDIAALEAVAVGLHDVRERSGRLFILGVGGSAAHASHAVNDFRKICGLESYAPTDNVAELTARINDDGWDGSFAGWLAGSRLDADDALLVFSVGGGDRERNISVNLIRALDLALERGARIFGIVGREADTPRGRAHVCRDPTDGLRPRDPSHRRPVRGDVAPDRESSAAAEQPDEMGVHAVTFLLIDAS